MLGDFLIANIFHIATCFLKIYTNDHQWAVDSCYQTTYNAQDGDLATDPLERLAISTHLN